MRISARKKLYEYIKAKNIGIYSVEELRKVGAVSDWSRVLRQLRQDNVIEYDYSNDRYNITEINEYTTKTKRAGLTDKDKYRIRHRDGHLCQSCGKGVKDGVKLHVDHKIPVDMEGSNDDDNLWTLCQECNLAKKAIFKDDLDSEVMAQVFAQKSGCHKLKTLFEKSPNKKYSPAILQGIAGIRDWERTIRYLRAKHNINIVWHQKSEEYQNGYYVNEV